MTRVLVPLAPALLDDVVRDTFDTIMPPGGMPGAAAPVGRVGC
jgi:hypothetical protein